MVISKERFTCKCKHVFDAQVVTHAPFDVTIASMKAVRCPKCGNSKVFMGGAHSDAPPADSSELTRAAWWRDRGDIGTSSLTIWVAFGGGSSPHGRFDWPHDPDDFRRCKALFDLLPEWRARISEVTARFPWMKPFVDQWGAFEELYAEEAPTGQAPKLYAALRAAAKEAEKIRHA